MGTTSLPKSPSGYPVYKDGPTPEIGPMANIALPFYVRIFGYVTIGLLVLWPRYIFFSVAGIGTNPLNLSIMAGVILIATLLTAFPQYISVVRALILKNPWVFFTLSLHLIVRLAATYFSTNSAISRQTFLRDIFIFLPFFVFCFYFTDVRIRRNLVPILLASAAIQAGFAIYERMTYNSIAALLHLDQLSVGDNGALAQVVSAHIRDGLWRAQALFSHPIVLGQFSGAVATVALTLALEPRLGRKIIGSAIVLLEVVSVFASGTRSALALAVIGFTLVFLFGSQKGTHHWVKTIARIYFVIILAVLGLVWGSATLDSVVTGRTAAEISSTQSRSAQLLYGQIALEQRPIFGYGPGLGSAQGGVVNAFGQATIDNYFLSLALDTGWAGLITWVLFALTFTGMCLKTIDKLVGPDRYQALGLFGFSTALFAGEVVQSISDLIWLQMVVLAWFASINAALISRIPKQPGSKSDAIPSDTRQELRIT